MTAKQKNSTAIAIVVLLLLYFLYYYFVLRKQKEKCPDGRDIPFSGNCADNPLRKDLAGNTIVSDAPKPDENGCTQPLMYTDEQFPITLGMKGIKVKQIQIALNTNYGVRISEDGYFGCKTLGAVRRFYNVQYVDERLFRDRIQNTLSIPNGL